MKIFQLLDAVCIALLCVSSSAYGEIITFDTSDNEFTPGVFNQGWWIESGFMFDGNDNVLTGNLGGIEHRSFFTFYLPSSQFIGLKVLSASFQMQRYTLVSDQVVESIGFFDVSTDAAVLNNNNGGDAIIFNDLGTGTSYGEFDISGDYSDLLTFNLNAAALTDIYSSIGSFFSLSGKFLTLSADDDFVFGGPSSDFAGRLLVEVQPIPIPPALWLFGSGLLGLVGIVRRKKAF